MYFFFFLEFEFRSYNIYIDTVVFICFFISLLLRFILDTILLLFFSFPKENDVYVKY